MRTLDTVAPPGQTRGQTKHPLHRSMLVIAMVFAMITSTAGLASAASTSAPAKVPAITAAKAETASPATSQVIAVGKGWVLVGSGHKTAATAQTRDQPLSVTNCGWVNCSVYYSRYQTLVYNDYVTALGGGVSAVIALCSLADFAGPLAAIGCTVVVGVSWSFLLNALQGAANSNGCLRIRFPAVSFYNDHSGFCTDY